MEILCPACKIPMEYDTDDHQVVCRNSSCSYCGNWVIQPQWKNFVTMPESREDFDQFRVSLAESEKKYNELFALVIEWAKLAESAGSYSQFVCARDKLIEYAASHDWAKVVCDEVDRTAVSYNGTTISKIDRIRAVRNLAHLFPGGVSGTMGLGEAKMFIEAHYNDDGSRK